MVLVEITYVDDSKTRFSFCRKGTKAQITGLICKIDSNGNHSLGDRSVMRSHLMKTLDMAPVMMEAFGI